MRGKENRMGWGEKEAAYEKAYRQGRQAKDIYKYIPDKYLGGVTNAFSDSDGYWIWLDEDYVAYDGGEDCGMIHEYNIADLKTAIKTIRKGRR